MRSVTCSTVSSSVAPGQAACTTIARKVKAGSSLRPRRKNDRLPASTAASMK